jgi:hypothetical protein
VKFLCLVYGAAAGDLDRLRPASTATTVRVRDGQTLVTDGPFVEAPEELTGFRVVESERMDEALAHAGELRGAAVEVRPEYVS